MGARGSITVACARGCLFDYLRPALHTQGAHLVHAQVAHVHALIGDLDGAALEVLLVEDGHLDSSRRQDTQRHTQTSSGFGFVSCSAVAPVCPLYLGLHVDVRHLVLSGLSVSLGSRLGLLSGHDCGEPRK